MSPRRGARALQIASVAVMLPVLVAMNFVFLGASVFDRAVQTLGRGLEMTVYLKPDANPAAVRTMLADTRDFADVEYASAPEATRKFLSALGPESLALLDDPKWTSPIPGTFALRLAEHVAPVKRLAALREWSARFKSLDVVDDVFFGEGFVDRFARFVTGARFGLIFTWLLGTAVGLLIVGNCIRLSFAQRRDEIEVLELVGATPRFIRRPFLIEGFLIGLVASVGSLLVSWPLHAAVLGWLRRAGEPWLALAATAPLPWWGVLISLATGLSFGTLGAWHCVRRLNTGWSAAS